MPNPAIDILIGVLLDLVFFEPLFPGMLTTATDDLFCFAKTQQSFQSRSGELKNSLKM